MGDIPHPCRHALPALVTKLEPLRAKLKFELCSYDDRAVIDAGISYR
jgi:hypothetical protein